VAYAFVSELFPASVWPMNVLLAPNSHSILTSSRLAIRPTALPGILLTALTYVLAGRICSDSLAARYGL
jgi:hypothetical protein